MYLAANAVYSVQLKKTVTDSKLTRWDLVFYFNCVAACMTPFGALMTGELGRYYRRPGLDSEFISETQTSAHASAPPVQSPYTSGDDVEVMGVMDGGGDGSGHTPWDSMFIQIVVSCIIVITTSYFETNSRRALTATSFAVLVAMGKQVTPWVGLCVVSLWTPRIYNSTILRRVVCACICVLIVVDFGVSSYLMMGGCMTASAGYSSAAFCVVGGALYYREERVLTTAARVVFAQKADYADQSCYDDALRRNSVDEQQQHAVRVVARDGGELPQAAWEDPADDAFPITVVYEYRSASMPPDGGDV